MSLLGFCEWLASTPWSIELHESLWVYPIVESVHVLTLCLFLGTVILLDLRLLGVTFRGASTWEVQRRLQPWTICGFVLMVISGALLFYAIPVRTYQNIFFRIKVAMLLFSGVNVAVFYRTVFREIREWHLDPFPPKRARVAAALSLTMWGCIVICGRLIAYNWFDPKPAVRASTPAVTAETKADFARAPRP